MLEILVINLQNTWILYLDDDAKIEQHLFDRLFTHIKSSTQVRGRVVSALV